MRLSRLTGIGLASLCLLTLSTACSRTPKLRTLATSIPEEFTEDCSETPYSIAVNGDLAVKILLLKGDLRYCNADKRAMRAYNKIISDNQPSAAPKGHKK